MFRKGFSNFELIIIILLITFGTSSYIINNIDYRLSAGIAFIGLVILIYTDIRSKFGVNGSMYNIFGYIEIHIKKKCKDNKYKFLEIVTNVIIFAIEKKKKVMIDTNLVKAENLHRRFGAAVAIYRPSLIQSFINFLFCWYYNGDPDKTYYRAIIDTSKLNESQIEFIKSRNNYADSKINKCC